MKRFIALLIIVSMACLVACAPKSGVPAKTEAPTPTEQVSENTDNVTNTDEVKNPTNTDGLQDVTNTDNTQATAVPSAVPGDSSDVDIELEEDILETPEATPTPQNTGTPNLGTDTPVNTIKPEITDKLGEKVTPVGNGNVTPTAEATPSPTEKVISLPMDFF